MGGGREEAREQDTRLRVVFGGANMQPALSAFFRLLFVLLCLLGILANGLIVLVLSREMMRRGRPLPSDMILVSLGASRFCLQWLEW